MFLSKLEFKGGLHSVGDMLKTVYIDRTSYIDRLVYVLTIRGFRDRNAPVHHENPFPDIVCI